MGTEWIDDCQNALEQPRRPQGGRSHGGGHTGNFGTIGPTGRPNRIRDVSIERRDEAGLIRSNREYFNVADYLTQVGLFPPPS